MSDKSVKKRTKRWVGGRTAIRYRWHERWGDWRCAVQDAKAGRSATSAPADTPAGVSPPLVMTPSSVRSDGPVWSTPRITSLGQLGRGRAEHEWIRCQAETADLQVAVAQLVARRAVATAAIENARHRMDQMPQTAGRTPAPGEEAAGEFVHAGRRQREHEMRRQALAAEITRNQAVFDEAEVELARISEQVRIRWDVAEVNVAMIEAYVRLRCSAYLACLVRRHPDGERIGSLLRSEWTDRPSWIESRPVAGNGGA